MLRTRNNQLHAKVKALDAQCARAKKEHGRLMEVSAEVCPLGSAR